MSTSRPGDIFKAGDLLNNTYRIEAVLGRGGTSEVYRARSEISGRVVAMKALRAEFSRNEDYLVLMTREEDIREIRHDAIVRYYDNQRTEDGHVYLVMDYVDGPALDRKLAEGGMSASDLLVVCERVVGGLAAAHARNIIHRDLSPDNIILRGGDPAQAVIIDFGIAKDANPGAQTIVGNEFAGKYAYAAPEQLSGQTDARADIYALGALLLAVFRGKVPEIGRNPMEVVQNKTRPLDTDGVPEPLKSLIDRMTHPDRMQRLQSAEAVLEALRAAPAPAHAPVPDDDDQRTVIVPRATPGSMPRSQPPASPARAADASKQPDPIDSLLAARAQPGPAPGPAAKAPRGPATPPPPAAKPARGGMIAALAAAVLVAAGAAAWFFGLIGGAALPTADPYTLLAERNASGAVRLEGNAPTAEVRDALAARATALNGTAEIALARGAIAASWGADIGQLIDIVAAMPEWRIAATGDRVRVTGLAADRASGDSIRSGLGRLDAASPLEISAAIEIGPRFLSAAAVVQVLRAQADCGELVLSAPPATGFPQGATVTVTGRLAGPESMVRLSDAVQAVIGDRKLQLQTELLNPTLCLIDSALPTAPPGGFEITFGYGDRPETNTTGRYLVGENPVIDVTVPASVTDGFLFVSVLDVSGMVFHLLPNLLSENNDIKSLRGDVQGPLKLRVAYPADEAVARVLVGFRVDDSVLGKSKVLVIHSDSQVFDGLRPTTESAQSYAEALSARSGPIRSLDQRVLETARP